MESQFPSTSMQDSSSTIPNLPPELITEIFSRLPVKSLLRYRSISTYLFDLISSPEFIKSHLNLSTSNKENSHHRLMVRLNQPPCKRLVDCSLRSLLYDSVTETSDLHLPINNRCGLLRIVGSVNGLICLTSVFSRKKYLFLWNPSIRKCWKLPSFESGLRYVSHYGYGFIYDEFRDDYKVILILFNFRLASPMQVEVKIYSLMSNSWRSVDHSLRPSGLFLNISGKFVNGKLHWATCRDIFSIDMSDEKWGKVEKPSYGEGDMISGLQRLGSNLSVVCYNREKYVSIWVMKEYGIKESWIKMFTINYVDNPYGKNLSYFMSNKGEILVRLKRCFKRYNPKDDSFSPNIIHFDCYREAMGIYVESLVSPFPSEGRTVDATKIQAGKAQIKTIK